MVKSTFWMLVITPLLACVTPMGTMTLSPVPAGGGPGVPPPARCVPECARGERCNLETRTCETLPCGGRCQEGQTCDESGSVPRCVSGK
jgi:hypothetical protein